MITNGYATLSEVKAALRIQDSIDDSLLEMAIESASRLVDGYANRNFYNAGTAVRYYAPETSDFSYIDDLISISSLETSSKLDGTYDRTWTATEYQLEPLNGKVDGLSGWPYTSVRAVMPPYSPTAGVFFPSYQGVATIKITGVWGWTAVPMAVKQATIIQASRVFKRLDSPLGVLSSPDLGYIRVGTRLDPDVQQLIEPYRLTRFLG